MVFREPHTPGKTPVRHRTTIDSNAPRSSFAPASSSAAMRRSSSVFGPNLHGSTAFKDKRNLQGSKMVMVQKIVNFCNGEFALDDVRQPTRRKFLEIFTYIYGTIEDNYSMQEGKKSQDEQNAEIIKVFRNLGYPVTIKNSTLQSLGAPNSWPHLLGALTWMVELVEFYHNITLEQFMNNCEKGEILRYLLDAAIGKKFFEMKKDNMGENEKNDVALNIIKDHVPKFTSQLEACLDVHSKLEESTLRCKELEDEITALEQEKQNDRCPRLQEEIKTIDLDIKNLETWVATMKKEEEKTRKGSESERREIEELDANLSELNAIIKDKQRKIEEQTRRTGLDSAAIRVLAMEKESLDEQLKEINNELEKLSKVRYNLAPKATTTFVQEQAKYRRMVQRVYDVRRDFLEDADTPLMDSIPNDIKSLNDYLTMKVRKLCSATKTDLEKRLQDVESTSRRLASDERRLNEEDIRVEKTNREEEMAMEKEDRERMMERENWERENNLKEREKQSAEVEKESILGSQKEIGQLKQLIDEAELDLEDAKNNCHRKKVDFDMKLEDRVGYQANILENEILPRRQVIEGEIYKLEKFIEERAKNLVKK